MSDNTAGTVETIAIQIAGLFRPAHDLLAGGDPLRLFAELGVQFPPDLASDSGFSSAAGNAGTALGALPDAVTALLTAVDGGQLGAVLDALKALTNGISAALSGFSALPGSIDAAAAAGHTPGFTTPEVSAFTSGLAQRIFDFSAVSYLEDVLPRVVSILDLLGVVERSEQQIGSTDPNRPQYTLKVLHLDKLARALSAPLGALDDLYGFGSPTFDGTALFTRMASAFSYAGFPVFFDPTVTPATLDTVFADVTAKTDISPPGLALAFKEALSKSIDFSQGPVTITSQVTLGPVGATLVIRPDRTLALTGPGTVSGGVSFAVAAAAQTPRVVLVGEAEGSRLDVGAFAASAAVTLTFDATAAAANGAFQVSFDVKDAHLVLAPPSDDGFLSAIFPSNGVSSSFDLGFVLGPSGFSLRGSASLTVDLPLNLDLGVATVDSVSIGIGVDGGALTVPLGASIRGHFGPVEAQVQGIGIEADFHFPGSGGNLGPVDVSVGFKAPTGVGISVDAGAVHGGGFLFIGDHQYAGVLELSVVSVVVKAFGLIQTQLPDGTPGFSFVIVIIAEFTPIQLGFGFTLLGVGGLLGVNRTMDQQALSDAVRTGSLEHLLFPDDPVDNAPAIIHDLATVFPAAKGHVIVGPMAKLGWGTPTLISADLGIIIEFPGPRLALLGILRMLLPDPDAAILRLQMAVDGLLDFPAKKVSIDASLYDSTVAGFTVTADMAYRMDMGSNPSFLISIGGFNTAFQPPAPFPTLRRASVDLGISGNPSLVASGYFALTSNTAQIGASIQLHASGFGINLDGWLGFDVMFVFSPFSFTADISAGVRVSFHGVGFGINLHGSLSGPTPWHLNGRVCVSILWWDACLPVDITFGNNQPAALPEIDPWTGDPTVPVVGLQDAISDARNWSGGGTPAEIGVVSLSAAATAEKTPIDPVGAATLRQKVAPLNRKLEKFGEYKPIKNDTFSLGPGVGSVTLNGAPVTELAVVEDDFAPGHFMNLTNDQKLSLPSYEPMDAGVSVAADRVGLGSASSVTMQYVTKFIDAAGTVHDNQPLHTLTQAQLVGLLKRSATALNGVRKTGTEKYMLAARTKNVQLGPRAFVVADSCSLVRNSAVTGTPVSQTQALLALRDHLTTNPQDASDLAVVPAYAERLAA